MPTTHVNDAELKNLVHFSDLAEESFSALGPIPTYEQVPLVTLEEAIELLLSIVLDIKRMVLTVKENVRKIRAGLTSNKSASIMLYSMEQKPNESV